MRISALEREAEILQRLSDDGHPTAVRFHGYVRPNSSLLASTASGPSGLKDPNGMAVGIRDCHCLVMEAVHGEELFSYVVGRGSLPEAEAAPLMAQLVEGALRAHVHGIVHRDIKLENVLYVAPARPSARASLKLIDWGLAHVHRVNADGSVVRERLFTRCGSRSYMAPEVVACKWSGVGYDGFAADVWSLGISLFAMVMGFFPLESADPEADWRARKVLEAQRAGRSTVATIFGFYPSRKLTLSDHVWLLLDSMFRFNPAERCTLDSVLRCAWLHRYVAKPPYWLPPLTARAQTPSGTAYHPKERQSTQSPGSSVSSGSRASSCSAVCTGATNMRVERVSAGGFEEVLPISSPAASPLVSPAAPTPVTTQRRQPSLVARTFMRPARYRAEASRIAVSAC